ncbi:hypothetical protein TNCV_391981 [Trichonephila clavipes]|nr:hypothetical protein TNCV_391981 [Trichonephila clavipes]
MSGLIHPPFGAMWKLGEMKDNSVERLGPSHYLKLVTLTNIVWFVELESRTGLSADTLLSNNKWWNGPTFLRTDELPETVSECPELNKEEYLPELKSKDSKKILY